MRPPPVPLQLVIHDIVFGCWAELYWSTGRRAYRSRCYSTPKRAEAAARFWLKRRRKQFADGGYRPSP